MTAVTSITQYFGKSIRLEKPTKARAFISITRVLGFINYPGLAQASSPGSITTYHLHTTYYAVFTTLEFKDFKMNFETLPKLCLTVHCVVEYSKKEDVKSTK